MSFRTLDRKRKTALLIDLANIGKTLEDKRYIFEPGPTLDAIRVQCELVGVWGFADFGKQPVPRPLQLELSELGVVLIHTPMRRPEEKKDDAALIAQGEWLLEHYELDAIHILSGDGDYFELASKFIGANKQFVLDSSGQLAMSGYYQNLPVTWKQFLKTKLLTSEDRVGKLASFLDADMAEMVRYIQKAGDPKYMYDYVDMYFCGAGYSYSPTLQSIYCVSEVLQEIIQTAQSFALRGRPRGFEVIRDRVSLERLNGEDPHERICYPLEYDRECIQVVMGQAVTAGLLVRKEVETPDGPRKVYVPNMELYRKYFECGQHSPYDDFPDS